MRSASSLTLSALLATTLSLSAAPAQAAASNGYLALGDSYASGLGSRTYYADGTSCYRSPDSYGALTAARYGLSLTLAACSGAVTNDVATRQLRTLSSSTAYVTITVGGNDVGFSPVLTECAMPGWMSNCKGAIDSGLRVLSNQLPGRITTLLRAVRNRAPGAKVVLTGYPRLFNNEDCHFATFFSNAEEVRLNAATDQLNGVLQRQAGTAGVGFVNPVTSFSGHAWCDDGHWINGLSSPLVNSYHPNTAGHAAYAQLVGPALVGTPPVLSRAAAQRLSSTSSTVRLPSSPTSTRPFHFRAPNLNSAKATRMARMAGITTSELNRLRRTQRQGASNAALERLNSEITRAAQLRRR
ncbi:MAG TPA: SGNH/GDSL hydrolase family protein [Propionibacteriaceae bacterium]